MLRESQNLNVVIKCSLWSFYTWNSFNKLNCSSFNSASCQKVIFIFDCIYYNNWKMFLMIRRFQIKEENSGNINNGRNIRRLSVWSVLKSDFLISCDCRLRSAWSFTPAALFFSVNVPNLTLFWAPSTTIYKYYLTLVRNVRKKVCSYKWNEQNIIFRSFRNLEKTFLQFFW